MPPGEQAAEVLEPPARAAFDGRSSWEAPLVGWIEEMRSRLMAYCATWRPLMRQVMERGKRRVEHGANAKLGVTLMSERRPARTQSSTVDGLASEIVPHHQELL